MKIITPISNNILKNWNKQRFSEREKYRPLIYLKELAVNEGMLLYNCMTNELIFITKEEYEKFINNTLKEDNFFLYRFLVTHWFMIPESHNEKTMIYLQRNSNYNNSLVANKINTFIILPTTDCNARCYYCFELGAKRVNMSSQTAQDVAKYIEYKANPRDVVRISWFGGEPLFNTEAIDIISSYLIEKGFKLKSTMISNGYLFNDDLVQKAVNDWKLINVQITLDGTEETYNKTKAYIYKDIESPFKTVLNNIEKLIEAKISVNIRLNLGQKNYEDLYNLIDLLKDRFSKHNQYFSVHIAPLYENLDNNSLVYTDEERKFIFSQSIELTKLCRDTGLLVINDSKYFGDYSIYDKSCMADNPNSVMISPEGNLGSCEHYVDTDFFGSIYDTTTLDRDYDSIRKWRELREEKEECNTCFYYPKCYRLKGCISSLSPNSMESCYKRYADIDKHMFKKYYQFKNNL